MLIANKNGAIITFTNPANVRNRLASSAPLVIRHLPRSITFPWLPRFSRDPIDYYHHHWPQPNMYQYPTSSDTQRLAPLSDFLPFGIFRFFLSCGNEFPCIGNQKSLSEFYLEDLGLGSGLGDTTHRLFNFTVLFRGRRRRREDEEEE